jgi:alpha-tubulin suppressor-like RCC1 family protein
MSPTPIAVSGITNAKVVAGGQTMCTLESTGDVYCWGLSGTEIPGSYGVDAGCYGYVPVPGNCIPTPVKVAGVEASSLSAGPSAAMAITTQGKVVAWGGNGLGALGHPLGTAGDDSNDNNPTPTAVQGLP